MDANHTLIDMVDYITTLYIILYAMMLAHEQVSLKDFFLKKNSHIDMIRYMF
jgi:hypothetical protein